MITLGERLLLKRHRRGKNQAEAAQDHAISRAIYGQWERDQIDGAPSVFIAHAEPHEHCLLVRRRAGFTQAKVAEQLGCCRWTVVRMERGLVPCDRLLAHWGL